MTPEKRGLREKRYNRACCGVRCTRIPTGIFRGAITSPTDNNLLPRPGRDTRYPGLYADRAAGNPGRKKSPGQERLNRLPEKFQPGYNPPEKSPEKI
jgi:hypothetical protein